jgi:hypothetical protein
VAIATTAEDAHSALMSSSLHRDNLLSPSFNVAGFGVFRAGTRLYVAQDFGSSSAVYSLMEAQQLVAASVEQLRAHARMPQLERVESRSTQLSACAMAEVDSLSACGDSSARRVYAALHQPGARYHSFKYFETDR